MAKNLFVAGLSYDTTNDSLNQYFSSIGTVTSAQVIMDKYTNRSKGFGFVEMATDEEAAAAMEKLNNTDLDGRTIVVKEARPREESGSRSGGGFNRGGGGGGGFQGGFNRRDSGGRRDNNRRDRY